MLPVAFENNILRSDLLKDIVLLLKNLQNSLISKRAQQKSIVLTR